MEKTSKMSKQKQQVQKKNKDAKVIPRSSVLQMRMQSILSYRERKWRAAGGARMPT